MNVFIRTDSSVLIGSGHIMRCLTLSDMLKKEGHQVSFVCRDLPGNLVDLIKERGYSCLLLSFSKKEKERYRSQSPNDDYSLWRGVSQKRDVEETIKVLLKEKVDLLVIDHYAIDFEWESQLRNYTKKVMVIDDLANRKHDCDILLDHNFYIDYEKRYDNLVPKNCKKLLGPQNALINPSLRQVKENRKRSNKDLLSQKIKNIVIFLGGIDLGNYTNQVLEETLHSNTLKYAHFDVVLGKKNPNKAKLKQKYALYDNVVFHVQPSYYHNLLEKADLAVGACGVSVLERGYIRLPSVVMCVADNQKNIFKDLKSSEKIYTLESLTKNTLGPLIKMCVDVLNISEIVLSEQNFQLRLVTMQDAKDIYDWRTSENVQLVSNNSEEFSFESHLEWLKDKIASDKCLFLMGLKNTKKIGVLRVDFQGMLGWVSILLNPLYVGKGLGQVLLKEAIDFLKKSNKNITLLKAEILQDNVASEKLFSRNGFNLHRSEYQLKL